VCRRDPSGRYVCLCGCRSVRRHRGTGRYRYDRCAHCRRENLYVGCPEDHPRGYLNALHLSGPYPHAYRCVLSHYENHCANRYACRCAHHREQHRGALSRYDCRRVRRLSAQNPSALCQRAHCQYDCQSDHHRCAHRYESRRVYRYARHRALHPNAQNPSVNHYG
jgi:hypothetical protein